MSELLFGPTPHDEAIAFIRKKPALQQAVFAQLLPELKALGFAVTGIEDMTVLQAIRDRLGDLPAGVSWDKIKKDLVNQLHPYLDDENSGKKRAEARATLLLRTHGFQAYQAASYRVMDRQRDAFPYWQYKSMEDGGVRPAHAALDGIVLPCNHEFWKTHFPPWQWNCRCQVVPLSQDDYEDIQQEDANKAKDRRSILDDDAQAELTRTRRLVRNGVAINVSSDAEKGREGAYSWHPDNMRPDLARLRARYHPDVFAKFEKFAREHKLPGEVTVWDWLNGTQPAPATIATPGGTVPPKPMSKPKPKPIEDGAAMARRMDALAEEYRQKSALAIDDLMKANAALAKSPTPENYARSAEATKAVRAVTAQRHEAALRLLAVPVAERTTVGPGNKPKNLQAALDDGFSFLSRLTRTQGLSGAPVQIRTTRKRAAADPFGKYIDGKAMDASTVAHEVGHIIEARNPKILAKSLAFRASRTAGEKAKWLGGNHDKDEVALPDKWVERGGTLYSGKVYLHNRQDYATEILSVGLERLKEDAVKFMQDDRDYFVHVIDCLRGLNL